MCDTQREHEVDEALLAQEQKNNFNYDHVWVDSIHGKCCYVINNFSLCQGYEFINPFPEGIHAINDKTWVLCKECINAIKKIKAIQLEVYDGTK